MNQTKFTGAIFALAVCCVQPLYAGAAHLAEGSKGSIETVNVSDLKAQLDDIRKMMKANSVNRDLIDVNKNPLPPNAIPLKLKRNAVPQVYRPVQPLYLVKQQKESIASAQLAKAPKPVQNALSENASSSIPNRAAAKKKSFWGIT